MESVEKRALSAYQSPIPFWKRYVDDTVTALPRDQIKAFHSHLNSFKTSIQFTVGEETDNTLSFLDTKITHHEDGSLTTTVFRKNRHTNRYLDFQSHHPLAHKMTVSRTLLHQADRIALMYQTERRRRSTLHRPSTTSYPRSLVARDWHPSTSPPGDKNLDKDLPRPPWPFPSSGTYPNVSVG